MSRKRVERNISYDDVRKVYYVTCDYGKGGTGKRIKTEKTYKTKAEARRALAEFEVKKAKNEIVSI